MYSGSHQETSLDKVFWHRVGEIAILVVLSVMFCCSPVKMRNDQNHGMERVV